MSGMEPIPIFALIMAVLGLAAALVALIRSRRPQSAPEPVQDSRHQQMQAYLEQARAASEHERDLFDQKWGGVTAQMSKDLAGLRDLVYGLQKEGVAQHEGLTQNLQNAAVQQKDLREITEKLHRVLSNSRARGQWGERMADDILRLTGLKEGVNYRKQKTTAAGTRPDFTFLLPGGLDLHMDVKFPLDGYVRCMEAASDSERDQALKNFGQAVRRHVKALASRDDYKESENTVEFVLMFIPNEGVYAFIHEHHSQVLDEALEARVVVCSPSTLFAMLCLVRQAVETLALKRSSQEILVRLASFEKQWEKYVKQYEKVGNCLESLNKAWTELQGLRTRMLEKELDHIENLKSQSSQPALDM